MNCTDCRTYLPELLLDPAAAPNAQAHLDLCAACREELRSLQATFDLLDTWQAPEPSPYFDQKLAVLLRAEQQTAPAGWLERLRSRLLFNTGRQFRPALAGAFAVVLAVGVGTVVDLSNFPQHKVQTSATVNDLQILDKNDQALQTMDQLLQDDGAPDNGSTLSQPAS